MLRRLLTYLKRRGISLPLRSLPLPLMLTVGLLVFYGAAYVSSAAGGSGSMMAAKHLLWAFLGTVAFFCVYAIDFRLLIKWSPAFFSQPSEFTKIAYVLLLARFLATTREPLRFKELLLATGIMMAPVGLIMLQTDLGTAMTFAPVILVGIFVAGARSWHLCSIAGAGVSGVMVLWNLIDKGRKTRVYAWLNPEKYKLSQGYQLIQSQIASGSGGIWGKGLGLGTQNKFNLLPLKESDFIFAVIAEEGGFVRASGLLLLFLMLVLCGAGIALRARDRQGQMLAACLTALLGGQALINIAVTLGLLPTTGITLPFVSYGGSSMLTSFIAVGLLANIYARPKEPGLFD